MGRTTDTWRWAAWALVLSIGCGDDGASEPTSERHEAVERTQRPEPAIPTDDTPASEGEQPEQTAAEQPEQAPPSRLERRGDYLADVGRDCDGYPYLPLKTLPGRCVGLVLNGEHPTVQAARGRFRPRGIVQDPHRDDVMWMVDAGARRPRAGRLWRLTKDGETWTPEVVLSRLDRPHGIRLGPDGWVYVGEVQRIIRVDPAAHDPASTVERVVDDLPVSMPGRSLRWHPLTAFVFTPRWDIVLDMGSATDRCAESQAEDHCHDEDDHTAALWRFRYLGERRWSSAPAFIAHGLRNSVALVAHESGTLLQGENGIDFPEEDRPHEELNVIVDGKHYGWPYCYDRDQRTPEWSNASFACDVATNPRYAPPRVLLPPHGAPLGMMYYRGSRMPELTGRLLMTLHGYRPPGHRVILFDVDARGVPAEDADFREVIAGWDASDSVPRGNPVEMTEARDGSVWLVEDNNADVLRLSVDRWAASRGGTGGTTNEEPAIEADAAFTALQRDIFGPRCSPCHEHFRADASAALTALHRLGWLRTDDDGQPLLWQRIRPGATRRMPPTGPLSAHDMSAIRRWLDAQREPTEH